MRGAGDQRLLLAALAGASGGEIDGVLGLATIEAAATSTGPARARRAACPGDQRRLRARARVRRRSGATGVSGPSPPIGHAAITRDLARTLELEPGSRMSVHAYGTQISLVVDRVLPRRGVAGYWLGPSRRRTTCSSRRATFDFIRSTAGEVGPPSWIVAVSNRGGVEPGAARTDAATRQVRSIAAAAGVDAEVYPAKQRRLETADEVGGGFQLDVHGDGELRRPRRAAPAREPVRDARGGAQDGARDGARRRHAPLGARRRLRHRRLALRRRRDVPRRRWSASGSARSSSPSRLASSPPSTTASTSTSRSSRAASRARSRSGSSSHWRRSSARASASAG